MNYSGLITSDIECLLDLFSRHCADVETLNELSKMVQDHTTWHKAHGVFQKARKKNNIAFSSGNKRDQAQYQFEEICAKTIYNLSGESAPFDADSPYWVVPNALAYGRIAGIPEADILACISLRGG